MVFLTGILTAEYGPAELDSLLTGIAGGNRNALAELYAHTRTAVYALALSYLRNGQDADDVTQDTFVRVWEKAPLYRRQGTPMAWILTIAKNLALMKLREREKVIDLPTEEWAMMAFPAPAVTEEDRLTLRTALTVLDEKERQIILLHAVSGMKHREIGQLLDMPLATVLSKYHRGLKKLRSKLEGGDTL